MNPENNVADYDGDQVSGRGVWGDESNGEADDIMKTKMSALDIRGNNSKTVSKELFNSMYELTKEGPNPKTLGAADTDLFLSRPYQDITLSFLASIFADLADASEGRTAKRKKSRFNTWDKITIPKGYFFEKQPEIHTTVGRFILNRFVLQPIGALPLIGVVNDTLNKSKIGQIDGAIGTLYEKDQITREKFNEYTDRRDTLGYWLNGMLAHTISERMMMPLPEVEKKKAELCKKYEKELADHNLDVMTMISDELVAYAKEILKDDPGMDLYLSGDLDFGNNYKNNAIIKGAVKNELTGEFDFIATSFMDGIDVKDIPAHANSILASQYPASISTAEAGYTGKKLLALLQMMGVDEPGTDCGTKHLTTVTITEHNKNDCLYSFIAEGDQLIELDEKNINKYVGKVVQMRSPMSCLNDKICSKCAGNLFYMLGIKHAGLFATQISHSALNLGLKAKHNSLVELYMLDPNRILEPVDS